MSSERAPADFRSWDNLPKATRVRAIAKRVLGVDPAPPDDVARTFASMYFDADSIADAPESLLRLFADIEQEPDWVDHELVERGARVFRRYGTAVFRFAGAITLTAYAESSVAKPLILTGAYVGGSARNRFLETAALAPGLGQYAMGYRTSKDDIVALIHFWRYVAHLIGVRPRWYPKDLREAAQLFFMTFVKGAHRAGEDELRLCQADAGAVACRSRKRWLRRYVRDRAAEYRPVEKFSR